MIVKYKFEVERRRHGRKVMEEVAEAPKEKKVASRTAAPPASRKARQLALAYYIERAVEAGLIKDYADAARRIGVSRARLTQIMDLLGMMVGEQMRLLANG